jgi:hypothetical protein
VGHAWGMQASASRWLAHILVRWRSSPPENLDLLFVGQQVYEASVPLLAAEVLLESCEPDAAGIGNPSSQQVFVG